MSGDNLRLDFSSTRSAAGPGAPTLTTPTLTPTTLRNIEQMFLDHESSSILDCPPSPPVVHENAAHFVPPYVALTKSDESEIKPDVKIPAATFAVKTEDDDDDKNVDTNADETESKPKYLPTMFGNHFVTSLATSTPLLTGFPHPPDFASAVVRPLPPEVALRLQLDFGPTDPAVSNVSPALPLAESSGASNSSATSSRGKRQLSSRMANASEDEKRRLMRRQRNKEAAARCRKRRFDQTMSLEDEVSQWEERNNNAKLEIENLEAQKRHLLSLLDGHRGNEKCKLKKL